MLMVNPAFPDVTEAWFDPGYWGEQAKPVDAGGRGGAWFIDASDTGLVLRHYRRGGLVARVSESHYLFTGREKVRSVAEFELLKELYELGLTVPQPVAAWYRRAGLFYRAAIIIERIPGAVTFGSVWRELDEETWTEIGRVIRRFHDAGVFHSDLNCFNILLRSNEAYLIDFDKCRREDGSRNERWKQANLERLHRSLEREVFVPEDRTRLAKLWPHLMNGYEAVNAARNATRS